METPKEVIEILENVRDSYFETNPGVFVFFNRLIKNLKAAQ